MENLLGTLQLVHQLSVPLLHAALHLFHFAWVKPSLRRIFLRCASWYSFVLFLGFLLSQVFFLQCCLLLHVLGHLRRELVVLPALASLDDLGILVVKILHLLLRSIFLLYVHELLLNVSQDWILEDIFVFPLIAHDDILVQPQLAFQEMIFKYHPVNLIHIRLKVFAVSMYLILNTIDTGVKCAFWLL